MNRIRDRPEGFAQLTWENFPSPEARCEIHHYRTRDGDHHITVSRGEVLLQYLRRFGEMKLWFRVVKEVSNAL